MKGITKMIQLSRQVPQPTRHKLQQRPTEPMRAKMRRQLTLYLLAFSFALSATSNVLAQDPTFTTIDFPGATFTNALGINPRGDIVGFYTLSGTTHGFLRSGGQFTSIDFPGATLTNAMGINP